MVDAPPTECCRTTSQAPQAQPCTAERLFAPKARSTGLPLHSQRADAARRRMSAPSSHFSFYSWVSAYRWKRPGSHYPKFSSSHEVKSDTRVTSWVEPVRTLWMVFDSKLLANLGWRLCLNFANPWKRTSCCRRAV